jgi:cell division septation protein DedD
VSPERDDPTVEEEYELYEDVPPRSIFAATWFRVVLVVIVLGVIGAVAVPYVLDWMSPPPAPRSVAATKSATSTSAPEMSTADKASSSERSSSEKSASDKPAGDKRDSTVVPAPTSAPLAATPARPEAKNESAAAKPAVEPKSVAKSPPSEAKASTPTERKSAMAVTESPAKKAAVKATTPASPSAIASDAPYWVQVGAFKDPEMAKRMARKLRDEKFKVEESLKGGVAGTTAPAAKTPAAASGSEQYDVFVSGAPGEDLKRRLAGKGLTGEETPSGSLLVKPSQSLRDAVALSKDLAVDGLKVQVRRAGSATIPSSAPPLEGSAALHRVRVGAFPDKGAAQAAARELEAKGYKPFIARGDQ